MAVSPDISVLINTYNRPQALVKAVAALSRQQGADPGRMEIVIVDDGSATSPAPALGEANLLGLVRLERRPHAGPSAARNAALGLARGQWIIFLGDDIVAHPGLVAAHMRLLTEAPEAKRMSLGHCRWEMGRVSPPLRELAQVHHYEGLAPGQKLGFRYFYTANVALPRRAVDEAGLFDPAFDEGFEEGCVSYGWEDIELGYRLLRAGWELIYNPSAAADHIHPRMSVADVIRRQAEIGFGACRLYAKYGTPEVARVAFWPGTREASPGPEWRRRLGCAAAEALERVAPRSRLLRRVYARLFFSARCKGVAEAKRAFPNAGI